MIKAAFFDVDGTLVSFSTHDVPESTVRAIRALRERGVKIFIATGRATCAMPEPVVALANEVGVDGMLAYNGQLCYDEAGVFRDAPIDDADVRAILRCVEDGAFDALVLQADRIFVNRRSERVVAVEAHVGDSYPELPLACAYEQPVYQMCAFVDPGDEHVFMDGCSHVQHARWCEGFCDVMPADGGKPAGVLAALERNGIDPSEAIAFGDGGNDIGMFGCVGTSVAMGNAGDDVKAAATYVTSHVDDDGVWRACEHFGLV